MIAHMQGSQGRLQPQGSGFNQPQSIQPAASTNDTTMSAQIQPAASAHSDVDMATESSVDSLVSPITTLVGLPLLADFLIRGTANWGGCECKHRKKCCFLVVPTNNDTTPHWQGCLDSFEADCIYINSAGGRAGLHTETSAGLPAHAHML